MEENLNLSKLKLRKRLTKSAITRIENDVNKFDFNIDTIDDLNKKLERLDNAWADFQYIVDNLVNIDQQFNETSVNGEVELVENQYERIRIKSRDILKDLHSRPRRNPSRENINDDNDDNVSVHSSHSSNTDVSNTTSIARRHNVRLPKIDLSKFYGNTLEWNSFYNIFESLIDSDPHLDNIQKFLYLKSVVKGEAAVVISSLDVTSEQYKEALKRLCERYDNRRIVIQGHIQSILDLPAIKKESFEALRQLLVGVLQHVRALTALKRPTEHWDDFLIQIIKGKLDTNTIREWELKLSPSQMPTFKELIEFLNSRCHMLEAIHCKSQNNVISQKNFHYRKVISTNSTSIKQDCAFCHESHPNYSCSKFRELEVPARISLIRAKGLCLNCLRSNHLVKDCKSSRCKFCNQKHNSLIHSNDQSSVGKPIERASGDQSSSNQASGISEISSNFSHSDINNPNSVVLLSTAVVKIKDVNGEWIEARALLDSGSQASFISEKLANRLQLPSINSFVSVNCINQTFTNSNKLINIEFQSRFNDFNSKLQCIILPKISTQQPIVQLKRDCFEIPNNLRLADPRFYIRSDIDILIGADQFWNLLCGKQIKINQFNPLLIETVLGWILSGNFEIKSNSSKVITCHFTEFERLDKSLAKFWEVENINEMSKMTAEEQMCETLFLETTKRNETGRFIVQLPVNHELMKNLGDSKQMALKRFFSLERSLDRNPALKHEYSKFLDEYRILGHMQKLETQDTKSNGRYYIPHHAVIKESSSTTRVRVVFDGSAKTSNNLSLNDVLLKGPVVQSDMFQILVRFRMFVYVLCGDISKMYRRILVDPKQVGLQTILWRDNKLKPIETFELLTVTYGLKPSSFLATRCVQKLVDGEEDFTHLKPIIYRDFYVDDIITGSSSQAELQFIKNDLINLMSRGGFELHKWRSNVKELADEMQRPEEILKSEDKLNEKTLGVVWDSNQDIIQYSNSAFYDISHITKRAVLSEISKIFDPLRLIGPIVVNAKIIIQRLWILGLGWDEPVPQDIHESWNKLKSQIHYLSQLRIPRLVMTSESLKRLELHGFCDASLRAYVRSIDENEEVVSNLLCAKSRVSPVKTISLPRLELCGAVLLMRLMKNVEQSIITKPHAVHYWTDSEILLSWLRSPASRWQVFVAHRIGEIQEASVISQWHHVSSKENAADVISRGMMPQELISSSLWWHGPTWLSERNIDTYYKSEIECPLDVPEMCKSVHCNISTDVRPNILVELSEKYSSFTKLIHVIAYVLRFIQNCKLSKNNRNYKILDSLECHRAEMLLISHVQLECFPEEVKSLKLNLNVKNDSKLKSLNPFISKDDVVCVKGRLDLSDCDKFMKYPIILPNKCILTDLVVRYVHEKSLHAGVATTLANVRTKYWPITGKNIVKRIIRSCVICKKSQPKEIHPLMGSLPFYRTQPARPFFHCGIDLCGPFSLRDRVQRKYTSYKAYVVVFVCMVVKAVHLEVVEDLTTESLLAALTRMMSRRGEVSHVYSDNGTNLVGANRDIQNFLRSFQKDQTFLDKTHHENIVWHFNPPRAPHCGGLWEAAVKVFKIHFKRIVGDKLLTIIEFNTLLTQIEAIMNSRPLIPLSDDVNDFEALTPSHFLIGESMSAIQQPDIQDVPIFRLSRWRQLEQLKQTFWTRWSTEYLTCCQQRSKWTSKNFTNLKVGQLVMLKEDERIPFKWVLGRIENIFPGRDNIVRVIEVRTKTGIYKRPVVKIAVLPIDP